MTEKGGNDGKGGNDEIPSSLALLAMTYRRMCHCEPLDEAKQSLPPYMSLRGHEVAVAVSFGHCEGLDAPKQSLSKPYEKATTRLLRLRSQ